MQAMNLSVKRKEAERQINHKVFRAMDRELSFNARNSDIQRSHSAINDIVEKKFEA